MKCRGRSSFWLLVGLFIAGAGYLWWDGAPADFDEEESGDAPQIQVAATPSAPVKDEKLGGRLQKGDSFRLRKTVTETVTQHAAGGPFESRTTLKILLAVYVKDVQPKKTRLRVEYQHVDYRRKLGAEEVHYDSRSKSRDVPLEAQPYLGLVDNGFEFWVAADHTVINVVDFRGFLERCVRHVSPAQRDGVLRRFVVRTGEETIANFIDDSFGLLPKPDVAIRPGATWSKHRRVDRPIPLDLTGKCQLTELNARIAKIEIRGKVTPSASAGRNTSHGSKLQLTVTGGTITGQCRIQRGTGLPVHSEITRVLDMEVRLPNGAIIPQRKTTTTAIAFDSPQGSPTTLESPTIAGASKSEPRRISRLSNADRR